ncbi:MAG: LptA/OstA family protein [Acidobacteriaceae bacterium]
MRVTIEKLRIWLLVAAGLLVGVIVLFLGYARYQMHRAVSDLPQKLGIEIQQSTSGFTFSKSDQGRTLFTIHASRAVQLKNGGKARLHDVNILLYGRKSNRADRIYGSEFDYDPSNEIARADGPVDIDLQTPSAAASMEVEEHPSEPHPPLNDKSVIHAKTSGLVFSQKTGVATTGQDIEFQFSGVTGTAHGAQYVSSEGLLVLQSNVNVRTLMHGRPVLLAAAHAELHRDVEQVVLSGTMFHSLGISGRADTVTVQMRKDGTAEHVQATGHVTLVSDSGSQLTAPRAEVALDATSQPLTLDMLGGLHYVDTEPTRHAQGEAAEAHVQFGKNAAVRHVQLLHAVQIREQNEAASSDAKAVVTQHQLDAERVEVAFDMGRKGKPLPRQLQAFGGGQAPAQMLVSTLSMVDSGVGARPGMRLALQKRQTQKTVLRGDELDSRLTHAGGRVQVSSVQATGHTSLTQVAANGNVQTSTGDRLDVRLKPTASPHDKRRTQSPLRSRDIASGAEIESAIQQGHVVITQEMPNANGHKENTQTSAKADRAAYHGDTQLLVLTGNPQVVDGGMTLWAKQISLSRMTGDALAEGSVKGSYAQAAAGGNGAEPVHIVADHAVLRHAEQQALFYGGPTRDARLWQGASQVEAPVLDFERAQQTLTARADTALKTLPVHAVFLSMAKRAGSTSSAGIGVVRVSSQQMVYSDAAHRADFTGTVQLESMDGKMRADTAEVFLQPASNEAAGASKSAGKLFGGSVQRVMARGQVALQQPGRHGSGEQLVYTAGDGRFVLTGTAAAPPKLVDDVKGTVSGTSLIFNSSNDSVIVSGKGAGNGAISKAQRTKTETRVNDKAKE